MATHRLYDDHARTSVKNLSTDERACRKFVSVRAEIGKYVDEDVVASYESYLFVPIDPTNPDAVTFQQLPGLDEDEANQLADGGPYADDAALLTALAATYAQRVVTTEPVPVLVPSKRAIPPTSPTAHDRLFIGNERREIRRSRV